MFPVYPVRLRLRRWGCPAESAGSAIFGFVRCLDGRRTAVANCVVSMSSGSAVGSAPSSTACSQYRCLAGVRRYQAVTARHQALDLGLSESCFRAALASGGIVCASVGVRSLPRSNVRRPCATHQLNFHSILCGRQTIAPIRARVEALGSNRHAQIAWAAFSDKYQVGDCLVISRPPRNVKAKFCCHSGLLGVHSVLSRCPPKPVPGSNTGFTCGKLA